MLLLRTVYGRFLIMIAAIYLIVFAIDLWAYKGYRSLISKYIDGPRGRKYLRGYWVFTIALYVLVCMELFFGRGYGRKELYPFFLYTVGVICTFSAAKIVFNIFHFTDDILNLIIRIFCNRKKRKNSKSQQGMSRLDFLSRTGAVMAGLPLISFSYGMVKGRFDFRIVRQQLVLDNLPEAFHGLRIVQISDIHLGSLWHAKRALESAVSMMNALQPDLVFFTGDMVNNLAEETDGWENVLSSIHAGTGKYAVLGNHDYGDYSYWENLEKKKDNFNKVKQAIRSMGFRLLLNEWDEIRAGDDSMAVIGVENWGKGRFTKYGDLDMALNGTERKTFMMLLSHDPSHWEAKILHKTNIDITFSGHTHGFQMGIEYAGIKWSPAQYAYPQWAGLYRKGTQYLYVNRGLGYIGFPGRIGMPPEITCMELFKKKNI